MRPGVDTGAGFIKYYYIDHLPIEGSFRSFCLSYGLMLDTDRISFSLLGKNLFFLLLAHSAFFLFFK